jgi:hypothetical protein
MWTATMEEEKDFKFLVLLLFQVYSPNQRSRVVVIVSTRSGFFFAL